MASLWRFLGHAAYEAELYPPHKHHPRLVLFCVPSSIAKLRKVIQFPYGFGCGKSEIRIAMMAGNTSGRAACPCNILRWKDEVGS